MRPKNALLDDPNGAISDADVDGDADDDEDGNDRAEENLLTLPGGRKSPSGRGKEADDDAAILDPDDMARGAVAVTPEATGVMRTLEMEGS